MNFSKIANFYIILLIFFQCRLQAKHAGTNRRINLLRKFHNTLVPKIQPYNSHKTKIQSVPRDEGLLKLQSQIKVLLMKREINQFKLFY